MAVKIRRQTVIVSALIVLGLIFLTIGVLMQKPHPKFYAHSLRNWQDADAVAGYPIRKGDSEEFWTANFEPNLSHLTSLERFFLPTARHFSHPLGDIASIRKATKLGVEFTADGLPVRAAGNGLVLAHGEYPGYPGTCLLLGHRLLDKKIIQTLYSGLGQASPRVGEVVARGEVIGTAKDALYFETRQGSSIDLQLEVVAGVTLNSQETKQAFNRLDPLVFLSSYPPEAPPNALAIIRAEKTNPANPLENLQLDSESAQKLGEILQKKQ